MELLLLLLFCIVLAGLLFTTLMAVELVVHRGQSPILDAVNETVAAIIRRALLRPLRLIPTSRAMPTVLALAISVGIAGIVAGSSWKWILPTGLVPGFSFQIIVQIIVLPLLAALAIVTFLVVIVGARGIAAPADIATHTLGLCIGLFAVVAATTVLSAEPGRALFWGLVFAQCLYAGVYVRKANTKYIARVANDAEFVLPNDIADTRARFFWRLAQRGFVPVSYWLTRWTIPHPDSRESYNLRTVLAYHMHKYEEALLFASEGIAAAVRNHGEPPKILTSYRALSLARTDSISEAVLELEAAVQGSPVNYYSRSNLSYLLWSADRVDEAVAQASTALEMYIKDHGTPCLQTTTLLSLFLSEKVVEERAHVGRVRTDLVRSALAHCIQAQDVARRTRSIHWGERPGSLTHNLAWACVLLSSSVSEENRDALLSFAFHAFSRCVWQESHAASRFRIALLHMVGSRRFDSAEYQLKRILWPLQRQRKRLDTRFARLVQLNLDRIEVARTNGVVFGPEILSLHAASEIIPEEAVGACSNEEASGKRNWLSLHLDRVFRDPFRHLPQVAKDAATAGMMDLQSMAAADAHFGSQPRSEVSGETT